MPGLLVLFWPWMAAFGAPAREAPAAPQDSRVIVEAAAVRPPEVAAGGSATLEVRIRVQEGYHLYGALHAGPEQKLGLSVSFPPGVEPVGAPEIPPGEPHESFGEVTNWVSGTATLRQQFRVGSSVPPGKVRLEGVVSYQACTESFCEPPDSVPFEASLMVVGARPAAARDPLAGLGPASSSPGAAPDIALEAAFEPPSARRGERTDVVVWLRVPAGWHVYGARQGRGATTLTVAAAPGLVPAGRGVVPSGQPHESQGETSYWLSGKVRLVQPMRVAEDAPLGEVEVRGSVSYVPCTERFCLLPQKKSFTARLVVEEGPARPERAGSAARGAPGGANGARGEEEAGGGLWSLIVGAVLAGLLALAMPCTYPMIPITFSFFTKQADERKGDVLPLALAYGAGIVSIFVLIGLVVGPPIVAFAQHWVTNAVIGTLFVVFALSLFGVIDLQPPRWLMEAASRASSRGGYLGVFLMGTTLVVATFTCTVPFLGALLGLAAQGGDLGRVALGMGTFGLTMAVPFVLLALAPAKMRSLPRSGEWMYVLKVFLGFVELAASLKFFSNVDMVLGWGALPRELFLMLWAGIFAVAALFLFGMFRMAGQAETAIGPRRMLGGLGTLLFALYCLFGAMGNPLGWIMSGFEPAYSAGAVQGLVAEGKKPDTGTRHEFHEVVVDDYERALARARERGKLLLVNFTGFT